MYDNASTIKPILTAGVHYYTMLCASNHREADKPEGVHQTKRHPLERVGLEPYEERSLYRVKSFVERLERVGLEPYKDRSLYCVKSLVECCLLCKSCKPEHDYLQELQQVAEHFELEGNGGTGLQGLLHGSDGTRLQQRRRMGNK